MAPKTFNLLTIGHRGVGKTVFLAGSYAVSQAARSDNRSNEFWFECRDQQARENLEKLLGYVSRTGQYPPPTMKITNFSFDVKHRSWMGEKILCQFRWWDIPGEICDFQNIDFQRILLASHGCCIFINAQALVNDPTYGPILEKTIQQINTIGTLINQSNLKYVFALVLTQCDLLEAGALGVLRIEECLQPFTARLDASGIPYQKFYSGIPISTAGKGASLGSNDYDPAGPLRWLLSELRKLHNFKPQFDLASGLKQFQRQGGGPKRQSIAPAALTQRQNWILGSLAVVGILGTLLALLFATGILRPPVSGPAEVAERQIRELEGLAKQKPNDTAILTNLASLYVEQEQYDQAIPLLQRLSELEPKNVELRLNLARLYQLSNQIDQEEAVYDDILSQSPNNLMAMTRKAVLRAQQGDVKQAKTLFAKAEQAAPNSQLKAKVQMIADDALKTAGQSKTP
jgi:tetratricopeptide (TPR) repeat protein